MYSKSIFNMIRDSNFHKPEVFWANNIVNFNISGNSLIDNNVSFSKL